jgi:hypothetical protein
MSTNPPRRKNPMHGLAVPLMLPQLVRHMGPAQTGATEMAKASHKRHEEKRQRRADAICERNKIVESLAWVPALP